MTPSSILPTPAAPAEWPAAAPAGAAAGTADAFAALLAGLQPGSAAAPGDGDPAGLASGPGAGSDVPAGRQALAAALPDRPLRANLPAALLPPALDPDAASAGPSLPVPTRIGLTGETGAAPGRLRAVALRPLPLPVGGGPARPIEGAPAGDADLDAEGVAALPARGRQRVPDPWFVALSELPAPPLPPALPALPALPASPAAPAIPASALPAAPLPTPPLPAATLPGVETPAAVPAGALPVPPPLASAPLPGLDTAVAALPAAPPAALRAPPLPPAGPTLPPAASAGPLPPLAGAPAPAVPLAAAPRVLARAELRPELRSPALRVAADPISMPAAAGGDPAAAAPPLVPAPVAGVADAAPAGFGPGAPAPAATARADAPAPLPRLDTSQPDWLQGMIDEIVELRREGGLREAQIRLAPDMLGTVEIRVEEREDGRMHVTLAADSAQARALLSDAAPKLQELAEARGVRLGQTQVDGGAAGDRRPASNPQPEAPARPATANRAAAADADPSARHRDRIA